MNAADLIARLADVVGSDHVLTDPDLRAPYEVDWTGRFRGIALAVVRPGSTEEVSEAVKLCAAAGVPLVPQGGNTGLVGGGVPRSGEVVLSLRRLSRIESIDPLAQEVTVGAGVTLARIQEEASRTGLQLGLELASRDSATVGGMVATNAGGVHVLRHGPMRNQVVGIEAVLPSGDVVQRLPGLVKDNSGYSLQALLAGSEGTLAVVTRARLRLVPVPAHRAVALLGFSEFEPLIEAVGTLRRELDSILALEAFFDDGTALVCRHARLRLPFASNVPAYLLVDCGAAVDPLPALGALVDGLPSVLHSVAATDRPARAGLWAYRERHTEAISAVGIPHKLDVTLPLALLAEFRTRVQTVVGRFSGASAILFGHVGDGNLHVNVLGVDPEDPRVDEAVFRLVADMGGSISSEHGIGRAKAAYLHLTRTPADLAWMRAVKAAFDPAGLLNPGIIFG